MHILKQVLHYIFYMNHLIYFHKNLTRVIFSSPFYRWKHRSSDRWTNCAWDYIVGKWQGCALNALLILEPTVLRPWPGHDKPSQICSCWWDWLICECWKEVHSVQERKHWRLRIWRLPLYLGWSFLNICL